MSNPDSGEQPNRKNGMTMRTEANRTPEHKAARDTLVHSTNQLLRAFKLQQDEGKPIVWQGYEFPIETEPRITQRLLGRNPRLLGLDMMRIDQKPGISLYGDGETSPLVFSAVLPGATEGSARIIEITGTDPMISGNEDGSLAYSPDQRRSIAARFRLESQTKDGDQPTKSVQMLEIQGDGGQTTSLMTADSGPGAAVEGFQYVDMVVHDLAQEFGVAGNIE